VPGSCSAAAFVLLAGLTAPVAGTEEKTPERARLQRGCDRGRVEDCSALAGVYQSGEGLAAPDLRRALQLYAKACERGHAESCIDAADLVRDEEELAAERVQALDFESRACRLSELSGCIAIVEDFVKGKHANTGLTQEALSLERRACMAGEGNACWQLSRWAAEGRGDLIPVDLAQAEAFAHHGCGDGYEPACETAIGLKLPRLTAAEEDDVREAAFRTQLRRGEAPKPWEAPFQCLALGTDGDPLGGDPPEAFAQRFAEHGWVKPRSWCVDHRTGDRISIGPVRWGVQLHRERTVTLWVLRLGVHGDASSQMMTFKQHEGNWVVEHRQRTPGPAVPEPDHAEDGHRIAALTAAFAAAWNRQDLEAMAALFGSGSSGYSSAATLRQTLLPGMTDTQLDSGVGAIEYEPEGRRSVSVSLVLRGTWTTQAGGLAPLEPWKQMGARSPLQLSLGKTTSWWEPGDWVVEGLSSPWQGHAQ
jgi:hypothetical protein